MSVRMCGSPLSPDTCLTGLASRHAAEESMSFAHRAATLRHALDFRSWPIRENSGRLVGYILAVIFADLAAIAVAGVTTASSVHESVLCSFACLCSAAMVEATKRAGENAGWIKDI